MLTAGHVGYVQESIRETIRRLEDLRDTPGKSDFRITNQYLAGKITHLHELDGYLESGIEIAKKTW